MHLVLLYYLNDFQNKCFCRQGEKLILLAVMASFVREVLTASGRLGEKEDFGGKASRLKLRVDDLKSNLRERIESRYDDFTASFNDVSIAVVQLENVIHEVEVLENSVNTHLKPNLAEAGREATEVSRQLKELSHSVQMANLTRKLFEDIETANEHLEAKKYLEASALLDCVGKKLSKAQVCTIGIQCLM